MGGPNHDFRQLVSMLLAMATIFAFVIRYTRLLVGIWANLTYKAYPVAKAPKFGSQDVTVVVPTTFKTPDELVHCLRCINACSPKAILIVTANNNVPLVRELAGLNSYKNVQVLGVEKLNKRTQMIKALKQVSTEIVVFADDDVFWPEGYLTQLLAIFENPNVGAGGTRQRVRRSKSPGIWHFLGVSYLERRVFNNITTNAVDGSISTLSGRSAAYRTSILKCEKFYHNFTHDTWLGRPLNTDDDKFLTRFLYSSGWEIALQRSTVLETSLEEGPAFLHQCLRWARAHWRGNFTVMTNETYWRSIKFAWGTYVIYLGQFQTPALFVDGCLGGLLYASLQGCSSATRYWSLVAFGTWLLFTKIVKLIPHFLRYPQDIIYLPAAILFAYLHGFLNLYAVCTMTTTVWGSQNLSSLEKAKAVDESVVPLLKNTMAKATFCEPTPGKIMVGNDYVSDSDSKTG